MRSRVRRQASSGDWADTRPVDLLDLATMLVLGLALLPGLVGVSPRIYWDVSPLREQRAVPVTVLGPAGAMWLAVAAVGACALALAVHIRRGGRLNWISIALGVAGACGALWQMPWQAGSTFYAGQWLGAMALGLAAVHLAQHDRPRRMMTAGLAAFSLSLLSQALLYVLIEHPYTVAYYLKHHAQTLAEHGWDKGSPQDLIYRRRLMNPEVIGVFGFSNVYGSLAAAITALSVGCGLGLLRRRAWRQVWGPGVLVAAGLTCTILSRSRGANISLVLASGLLIGAYWWTRPRSPRSPRNLGNEPREWARNPGEDPGENPGGRWLRWGLPVAAVLIVVCAVGGVVVRGALGPPKSAGGERSLLYRFYYWQAVEHMLVEKPERIVLGVGPGRFKALYAVAKNPLNPEDVASTHNVFLDYGIMLGLAGLAWGALLVYWLVVSARGVGEALGDESAGRASVEEEKEERGGEDQVRGLMAPAMRRAGVSAREQRQDQPGKGKAGISGGTAGPPARGAGGGELLGRDLLMPLFLVGAALYGYTYIVQWPLTTPERALGWVISVVTFVGGGLLLSRQGWRHERWVAAGALAGALVLLTHGQIEMTFYHPGAVMMAWFIMGLAAGTGLALHPEAGPVGDGAIAGAVSGAAPQRGVWLAPAALGVATVALAAGFAWPVHQQQQQMRGAVAAVRAGDLDTALRDLKRAQALLPRDPVTYTAEVEVELAPLAGVMGGGPATRQDQLAAEYGVTQALDTLAEARKAGLEDPSLLRARAQVLQVAATRLNAPGAAQEAVAAWRQVVQREPYSVQSNLQLADLLWELGERGLAQAAYRRVLAVDKDAYLDPLAQLSGQEMRRVRRRLGLAATRP